MPSSEALTDEYLAQLLAKDAEDRSIKYSSYGLQSLLPKRPTTNAPKPNTRFLKNIIKETDNHNAALRAKEVADAKARLRVINGNDARLGRQERREERGRDEDGHSSKRRRIERDNDYGRLDHRRDSPKHSHSQRDDEGKEIRRRRRRREDDSADSEPERSRHRRHNCRRRRSRSTSLDPDRNRKRGHRHQRRRRSRSSSPRRTHRSHQKPRQSSPSAPSLPPRRSPPSPHTKKPSRSLSSDSASDSDPLSTLIGPLPSSKTPPTKLRGRGSTYAHSHIDTHFAPSYDPNFDIHPPTPTIDDDWDNALEALRDRARWKQAGGERLRAAGFTDEEVKKWEKSGSRREKGEGDVEDVRWRGREEEREWDRGKVIGEDGVVGVEAVEWGRLKGT